MTLKKKQSPRPKKEKKETNIPVDMNSFLYQLEHYNLTLSNPKDMMTLPTAILYK